MMIDKNTQSFLNSIEIPNFDKLFDFIENNSIEDIAQKVIAVLSFDSEGTEEVKISSYLNANVGCFKTQFVGGGTVLDALSDMKENSAIYRWFYSILEDQSSKTTLFCILLYRVLLDKHFIRLCYDASKQYFDLSILRPRENEVFVDCGSYNGQNTIDFIENYKDYKKVYVYEPAPDNFVTIVENLKKYENIQLHNKAVSDKKGVYYFTSHMPNSANRINPQGNVQVEVSTIDNDIPEAVSFIKMDIESAEPNALLGAQNHIMNDKPNLAICVYHTITDIWTIPKIIYALNPNQKFYLKQHANDRPEEIVLYVSPNGKSNDIQADLSDKFDHMLELTQIIEEASKHTKKLYHNGEVTALKEMLDTMKMSLSSCINMIDDLESNIY